MAAVEALSPAENDCAAVVADEGSPTGIIDDGAPAAVAPTECTPLPACNHVWTGDGVQAACCCC